MCDFSSLSIASKDEPNIQSLFTVLLQRLLVKKSDVQANSYVTRPHDTFLEASALHCSIPQAYLSERRINSTSLLVSDKHRVRAVSNSTSLSSLDS